MKIEINNLKKIYGCLCVLDVDTLSIADGKITALVGPNGAGKSTLLSLIADLIERDNGMIHYDETEVVPSSEITLVFQEPYLISSTVRKNIAYPMKLRKIEKKKIEEKVMSLAKELKLELLLDKKAGRLSLGEVQKVALARALALEPKLLLLDEPCASIDPYYTSEIEKLLRKMNQNNHTTMIIVTHNLAQAKRLADEVVLLNQGKIVETGSVAQFFEKPKKMETKRFIEGELLV